jgi:hypothetical protein
MDGFVSLARAKARRARGGKPREALLCLVGQMK